MKKNTNLLVVECKYAQEVLVEVDNKIGELRIIFVLFFSVLLFHQVSIYGLSPWPNANRPADFDFSKVKWLHVDVSKWPETSKIKSVSINPSGRGQFCIDHTKTAEWSQSKYHRRSSSGGPALVMNPWIIVKMENKYYAGTYEWLKPNQKCKFGHPPKTNSLEKVYSDGEHSLGKHIKNSPLGQWVPKGGEVVGFMVSGLARSKSLSNFKERSNIQWYRMPSVDGRIKGGMLGSDSSEDSPTDDCPALYTEIKNIKSNLLEEQTPLFKNSCKNYRDCQGRAQRIIASKSDKSSNAYRDFVTSCRNFRYCRGLLTTIYSLRDKYNQQVQDFNRRQCRVPAVAMP